MTVANWLKARRASYFQDARRLAAMGDEQIGGGMTGEQWAIVYRAVAEELGRCWCGQDCGHPWAHDCNPDLGIYDDPRLYNPEDSNDA